MRIELQWAFSEADMHEGPCALCEAEFAPRAVIIRCDPYGEEACEDCLRTLSGRKEEYPRAPWPAWEEYRALVESHPEPMFASPEEVEASEKAGDFGSGEWLAYEESWLWRAQEEEDVFRITPTIIHRAYRGPDVEHEFTHAAATVESGDGPSEAGRALIVFRSEEEAEKYRAATGNYPEEEGFRVASLDHVELGHVLEAHDCTHVAMPEPWTEDRSGRVDFFEASVYIGMLRDSRSALAEGAADV